MPARLDKVLQKYYEGRDDVPAFGVLGVRAAELVHEFGNNSVEVDTIVEAWARRRDISVFWWGKR